MSPNSNDDSLWFMFKLGLRWFLLIVDGAPNFLKTVKYSKRLNIQDFDFSALLEIITLTEEMLLSVGEQVFGLMM